jgi:VWFA-related protein
MFLITVAILGIALFAQEITHETLVINIEVPVRVFRGDKFVEDLTIDDFEVFEDGKIQKIEAVYMIKKTSIEKKEGEKKFSPNISRNFVLLFQVQDYLPKIEKALDYFFNNVIMPGDTLTVFTPMKTYNFKTEALEMLPKEEIVKQLKVKIRKDTLMGNSEYKQLLRDIEEEVAGVDEVSIQVCQLLLNRLEDLRRVDENSLLGFAEFLKAREGQKYVFLFYQKELLPQLAPTSLSLRQSLSQDEQHFLFQLSDLFLHYRRDIAFDVERIKQVFSDSSISIHFLYITKAPILSVEGMQPSPVTWREQSEDIFSAFREMARATGGLTDSSSNAASAFQRVVDASENYYLIYYAPANFKRDGNFRNIDVKVKNRNYRIMHRAGYFAN